MRDWLDNRTGFRSILKHLLDEPLPSGVGWWFVTGSIVLFLLTVQLVTGLLLAWAEPVRLYQSPSFWIKMSLFALVGVHALVFRAKVYSHPEKLDTAIDPRAKLAAALSLILWAGLIVSGRLIAFDASFEGTPLHEVNGKYVPTSH